ncbi:rRNA-processing protein fcf2 [Chlorella vulgaris]
MVSTRSHSVLSADAAHGDIGGDVSSVAATPRRSGRLRGSGTATTPATEAPPRSSVRARRLRAIEEEPQAAQQPRAEQDVQVHHEEEAAAPASGKSARSGRRRSAVASPAVPATQPSPTATPAAAAAAATPATAKKSAKKASAAKALAKKAAAAPPAAVVEASGDEQADEADEEEPQQQPSLKAGTAVIDLLAEEMFAALNDAFGEGAGANDTSSGSSSESEEEEEQQQQQQGPSHAAMQQRGHDQEAAAASEDSENDSEGESEGGPAAHAVPSHLRWRPDLMLPGMQQERQPPRGGRPGSSSATAAAAAAAGVHAVRRAGDGLHVAPSDDRVAHKAARKAAPDTAGRGWFDLPATEITEEVKRDLRLLRLRGALDPKAFYKKLDSTKFPKYFQMGTVVEGAADFYSGRLTNKQRKRTLTEEIMADPQLEAARKKRYTKLQDERQALSRKRSGRKTDNERKKKSHHRAKH